MELRSLFKDCWMSHSNSVVYTILKVYMFTPWTWFWRLCVCVRVCVCLLLFVFYVSILLSSMDPCGLMQMNEWMNKDWMQAVVVVVIANKVCYLRLRCCCCWYKSEDAVEVETLLADGVPGGCRLFNTRQRDRSRHVRRVSTDRLRCSPTASTSQVYLSSFRRLKMWFQV